MGIKNAMRRLKKKGMSPDLQTRIDLACVSPHLHPRKWRNYDPNAPG